MNTRNQLILTHSGVVMALTIFIGSFVLTGWLPPPSPSLAPEAFAKIFSPDNVIMRVGVMVMCFCSPLYVAFASVITTQLKRAEGEHHVMANLQFVSSAAGLCLFLVPGFIWMAISYRTGLNPEVIMVLNDLAWFMFLAGSGPTVVQWAAIGCAILSDKASLPVFPRWLGFTNLWLAVGAFSGLVIPFVYSGPFAYNGLFGFWVVATVFFVWVSAMYLFTFKAVKAQAANE